MKMFLSLILILSLTGTAFADCHKTALTQGAMDDCTAADTKKADKELEAVYKKLMQKIGAADQVSLRKAEDAWSVYRDRQCAFNSAGTIGGSVHSMVVADCYTDMARSQTRVLQDQLDCEEGDLSCAR